jgi:hypothetical protein
MTAASAIHINIFGPHPIVVFGNDAQKSAWLPDLIHGRTKCCFGVTEPNAHPLNSDEVEAHRRPYVTAALNGDVDNYADLTAFESLVLPAEITTDAKVIPTLMSRGLDRGASPLEAFRATVASLEGSVAIAAAQAPGDILLALGAARPERRPGRDCFVVASEPYGLVERRPLPAGRRDPGRSGPAPPRSDRGVTPGPPASAGHRYAYGGTGCGVGRRANTQITARHRPQRLPTTSSRRSRSWDRSADTPRRCSTDGRRGRLGRSVPAALPGRDDERRASS